MLLTPSIHYNWAFKFSFSIQTSEDDEKGKVRFKKSMLKKNNQEPRFFISKNVVFGSHLGGETFFHITFISRLIIS